MKQHDYLCIITLEDDVLAAWDRLPEYSLAFDAEDDKAAHKLIKEHLNALETQGTIVRTCILHKLEYSTELIKLS